MAIAGGEEGEGGGRWKMARGDNRGGKRLDFAW